MLGDYALIRVFAFGVLLSFKFRSSVDDILFLAAGTTNRDTEGPSDRVPFVSTINTTSTSAPK